VVPVSGEGLRWATLVGVERGKTGRIIEEIEVQVEIGSAVAGVESVKRRCVPIDAGAPLSGGLNFGDAGTLEEIFLRLTGTALRD